MTNEDSQNYNCSTKYYHKNYGFEILGIVPLPPEQSTPGWREEDNEIFKDALETYSVETGEGDEKKTVPMPLVVMKLNPELREKIQSDGRLPKETQNFSNLNGYRQFSSAAEGYAEAARLKRDASQAEAA